MTAQQARVDPRPIQPPSVGSLLLSANNVVTGTNTDTSGRINPTDPESPSAVDGMVMPVTDSHPPGDYEYPEHGHPVLWIRGFSYRPEVCNGGSVMDPDAGSLNAPSPQENEIDVVPFLVEGSSTIPTMGAGTPELIEEERQKARRQLLACESKQIASELWHGTLSIAKGWGNRYLGDANCQLIEGDRLLGYMTALAQLERVIRTSGCGQQGMIHARADTVSIWDAGGALRRVGNLILTIHDTIVVSDAGYDGVAPRGATGEDPAHAGGTFSADSAWAYATTVVDVRRSDFIALQPIQERIEFRGSHQTLTTYERRIAAVTWGCLQAGVHVDHTTSISTTGS